MGILLLDPMLYSARGQFRPIAECIDKQKIQAFIAQQQTNLADVSYLNLDTNSCMSYSIIYKSKIPDAAMPLVRAVAVWTSRGDTPNAATVEITLPQSS